MNLEEKPKKQEVASITLIGFPDVKIVETLLKETEEMNKRSSPSIYAVYIKRKVKLRDRIVKLQIKQLRSAMGIDWKILTNYRFPFYYKSSAHFIFVDGTEPISYDIGRGLISEITDFQKNLNIPVAIIWLLPNSGSEALDQQRQDLNSFNYPILEVKPQGSIGIIQFMLKNLHRGNNEV